MPHELADPNQPGQSVVEEADTFLQKRVRAYMRREPRGNAPSRISSLLKEQTSCSWKSTARQAPIFYRIATTSVSERFWLWFKGNRSDTVFPSPSAGRSR